MKTLTIALAILAGSIANADGFVCATAEGDLKVQVYNQTQPEAGTRNAAIMVLSDPRVSLGRKTIAKFQSESVLKNEGSVYLAQVDLRYVDSSRKGELIGGTKLGFIDTIMLNVGFSYANPVVASSLLDATLTIEKRNGESTQIPLECERYLKN